MPTRRNGSKPERAPSPGPVAPIPPASVAAGPRAAAAPTARKGPPPRPAISVTSFFRDPEAFRSLAALLRPRLAKWPEDETLRAWVAACSTGEEAYSVAMLLAELDLGSRRFGSTQVFATDIDPNVIERARRGWYPEGIATDIGPERLEGFFDREAKGYRIREHIRERCVFAIQSLLRDPPFSRLDLLSCRNLLIYLGPETQQHLIPLFHYALKPGGLLLLGTSEAISGFEQLFKPLDRRHKIYERLPPVADVSARLGWHAPWPLPERVAPLQTEAPPRAAPTPKRKARAGRARVLELERPETRGALHGSIEELQSSNQERQTSKEELNAMNDALQALQLELQAKMAALSRANDDLANVLESTDIATIFLDRQLRIQRFTELAREVINLIPKDIGRPLGDLVSNLCYERMTEDARGVLETVRPHEVEVQTTQGYWRLMRILPYRTSQGVVEGVAIHFLDIHRVKRAELLAASLALADSIVHTLPEPLAVLDQALNLTTANPAFLTLFELGPLQVGQTSLFEIGGGLFAKSGVRALLERLLAEGTPFDEVQIHYSRAGGPRQLRVNGHRLLGPVAAPGHLLLALNQQSHD